MSKSKTATAKPAGGLEPLEDRRLFAVAVPVGPELLVNSTTADSQLVNPRGHSAAMDGNGNSVVVWQSYGNDGSAWGIFARRFDAAGAPRGPEFQVNAVPTDNQTLPAVDMDAAGNFVVAWRDLGRAGDSDQGSVYARRYNAAGVALGADFLVNTTTAGDQNHPAVAMGRNGQTVIAWDSVTADGSQDVFAQVYDASGARVGGEFRANTYTTNNQFGPSATVGADGRFVIGWESYGQDGDQEGIYAQRYAPSGAPQGGEFHVSTQTPSRQRNPGLDMAADGSFVVVWSSNRQDPSSTGVFSQRFDAAGNPVGAEYRVNVETYQAQMFPSVAMDDAGNYAVGWVSDLQDGAGSGIYTRQYNAAGVPQTGDVLANTYTTGDQQYPSLGMDARGNFIAAWQSQYQDGAAWGVYAQRFAVPDPNNTAPVAAGPQTITVAQDSPDGTVSLWDLFDDAQTPDANLTYAVVSNTNPAVTTAINASTGVLTLHYVAGVSGTGALVVRATDAGGLTGQVTLNVTVTPPPPTVPAPPSAPTAAAASARHINVGWADNSNNEDGFVIERSPNGTSGWAQVGTAAAGATTFGDTTVAPATTYFYRVSSTNAAGTSAPTAAVSATTPAENDVTQSYRADDPAVVWGGAFSSLTQGGRLARGMSSQQGEWTVVVNGHSATMSVFPLLADALSVTVDGVTTTPALTPNAWADVPLFTSLADGPHTVTIRNRYNRLQASLETGRMITATGSTPGLSLRPGFSQNIYALGNNPGVQTDGTMVAQTLNGNPNSLSGFDASFRIRTAASAIRLWMNLATDRVRLSIDGVEQQTASVVLPDGPNNNASGLGGMGWYDFATGLDTTREHEYRLWFEGTGTSSDTNIASQLMLVGGTLNTATPPAPLPLLVGFGDSITSSQGVPTNHDSGVGFVHRAGVARNMATLNMGVSGSTVHNFGGTGATGARSGTARAGQVPAGATDVFVLYGTNDAANSGIDAATFRVDYQNMVAGIRAAAPAARIYLIDLLPTRNAAILANRAAFNAAIAAVADDRAAAGDLNVIHVPTDGIGFDPSAASGHTYEGVHPTAAGYAILDPYFRSFMPSTSADVTAPTVPGASLDAAGTTLTLTFSETVTGVAAADYVLSGGRTLSNVQGTGATRTFAVSPAAQFGQAYTLGYTGTATRDASNNALATFAGRAVVNNVAAPDVTAPVLQSATADGATLTLAYNEPLSAAGVPAPAAFTVSGRTVTGVSVSGSSVVLTVSPAFVGGQAGGTVSYTPGAAPVRDAAGNAAAAFSGQPVNNVTVVVPNRNPVAADDTATTPANAAINVNVLSNDTDADGDALTVTAVGAAAHGTVSITAPGTVTYTPAAGYNGPDAFTYTVGDGRGGTSTATVRVGVGQFNAPPSIDSASTNAGEVGNVGEGQAVNLTAAFTDTGVGETHTASINWGDGSTTAGTVNAAARTAAGSHVYAAGGAYVVTLTVTDDGGLSSSRELIVYVTGAGVRGGVLYVIGTKADERVYTVLYSATQVRVTAPFIAGTHRFFDPASFSRVVMMLGDGNDQGSVYPEVQATAVLDGGAGNDALNAGGRALLVGGPGADTLTGGTSADILVGGTIADGGDPRRLLQVLDGAVALSSANVFNDANADTLTGGAGVDALWGNFSGAGTLDVLGQSLQPGETLSDLP